MFAALFGRHSVVAILQKAGADRTKQDRLGFSAATLSLAANPAETAHRFLRAGIQRTVDLTRSLR